MNLVFLNPVDLSVCSPCEKLISAPLVAAGISALGGLASSALSAGANASMNKATRDWQHDETIQARLWQEDMYNKYQSPQALVQQQMAAGLNPYIGNPSQGGSMPSSDVPQAPTPPTLHFENALGQGVSTYMNYKSMEAANASARADAMSKMFDTAMRVYKEYGKDAGDEFMRTQLPQFDMQGQKNITRSVDMSLEQQQVELDRAKIIKEVESKYSAKKAQSDLDMIDQQITESVARIGKMASDSKLNEAEIKSLAADVAKKIAETGYYKALGGQISKLTPYIVKQAELNSKMFGYDEDEANATWQSREEVRKGLRSKEGKEGVRKSEGWNPKYNSRVRAVKEFTDALNLNLGAYAGAGYHSGPNISTSSKSTQDYYSPELPKVKGFGQ